MRNEIYLKVPKNLNIDSLLPTEISQKDKDKLHDRIAYMIDLILKKLSRKKSLEEESLKTAIRLQADYLRQILGKHQKQVLDILQQNHIIIIDNNFKKAIHSRGYSLNPEYLREGFKEVASRSYCFHKKYHNVQDKLKKESQENSYGISRVIDQLEKNWKIDIEGAEKWMNKFEEKMEIEIGSSNIIPDDKKEEIIGMYKNYYDENRKAIKTINAGTIEYTIDNKGRRLHTPLTNMPRPLKCFIKYGEKRMCNMDITSSQPFMMAYVTKKGFWKRDKGIWMGTIDQEMERWIRKEKKEERNKIIKMLEMQEKLSGSDSQPINFSSLVVNGEIYEYLKETMEGKYFDRNSIDRFGTRQKVKTETLRIMYFDIEAQYQDFYKPYQQFKKIFPTECMIMELLKSRDHRDFPILLQRLESTMVLKKICGKIPEIVPFLTIHDSLIVPVEYNEMIRQLMVNTFIENFGFAPTIGKMEVLSPEYAFEQLDSYVSEKVSKIESRYSQKLDISMLSNFVMHEYNNNIAA